MFLPDILIFSLLGEIEIVDRIVRCINSISVFEF